MALIGHRAELEEDVVAFPTTKAAGAATITGTAKYPFEPGGSWGGANVYITGDTVSGDTINIKTYVSFDEGDSWVQVGANNKTTLAAGGGRATARTFIPFAPRVRVDAVFDASATLPSGHGCNVDIEFLEYDPETARTLFEDVLDVGDSLAPGVLATTKDGDTMLVNNPSKIMVWCRTVDASKIGDTTTLNLQGSVNASDWYTLQTLDTVVKGIGTGVGYQNYYELVEKVDMPLYLRLQAIGDSDTHWYTGHGAKFYVLAFE